MTLIFISQKNVRGSRTGGGLRAEGPVQRGVGSGLEQGRSRAGCQARGVWRREVDGPQNKI